MNVWEVTVFPDAAKVQNSEHQSAIALACRSMSYMTTIMYFPTGVVCVLIILLLKVSAYS